MKMGVIILAFHVPLWAQGWGYREAMLPWVQGRFLDAEKNFGRMGPVMAPPMTEIFLAWEADFEIERGRYGLAASLLRDAKYGRGPDYSPDTLQKRLARLYLSAGQFAEAERTALYGRRWDGKDIRKLESKATMNLVTLGEIYLARGNDDLAAGLLSEAAKHAKKNWSLDALEWIRAQNDLAAVSLRRGQVGVAEETAEQALATAIHEWGAQSIPAMDALDTMGVVRIAESKFDDAATALSQSRVFRESLYGARHPKVADSYLHAALLHAAQHDQEAAVQFALRSLEVQKASSAGGPNGRLALAQVAAGDVFAAAARADYAMESYKNAIPVLEAELGQNAPTVETARKKCQDLADKRGKD
jgi:hypothetical protein